MKPEDEYKLKRLNLLTGAVVALVVILMIGAVLMQPSLHEQQECPDCEPVADCNRGIPAPSSPPPSLSQELSEPVVSPAATEPVVDDWKAVEMSAELAGKWIDSQGRPAPSIELFAGREKSKTAFNVRVAGHGRFSVGCGFNADSEAWCKVFDDEHRKVPKEVKTAVKLMSNTKGVVLVMIEDIGNFEVIRKRE